MPLHCSAQVGVGLLGLFGGVAGGLAISEKKAEGLAEQAAAAKKNSLRLAEEILEAEQALQVRPGSLGVGGWLRCWSVYRGPLGRGEEG